MKTLFTKEELEEMNILTDYILKEQNAIDNYMNAKNLKLDEKKLIFVIQPTQENIDKLIYANTVINIPVKIVDFSIIFVPAETQEIIEYLINFDLLYKFDLYSFNMDIIPIDNDLFSLELEDSLLEIYIENNYSSLSKLANVLLKFEVAFGKIKHVYIKGNNAKYLNELLLKKEEEHNIKTTDEVLGMLIFDRSADFITPLLMNQTYEAMIDDIYGINNGTITVKKNFVKTYFNEEDKKKRGDQEIKYSLTSDLNKFYCKLRCLHYLTVNNYLFNLHKHIEDLKKKGRGSSGEDMKAINELLFEFRDMTKMVSYINDNIGFLKEIFNTMEGDDYENQKMKEYLLLRGISQTDSELFYMDYISEKKDFNKILNLLILESLIQDGIKNYEILKREMLNVYGFQNIFLFRNLEKLGLLKNKVAVKGLLSQKYDFGKIRDKLGLYNSEFKGSKRDDISYVNNGYCPISLKLIEKIGENGWSQISDALNLIPGETKFPNNESEIANPPEKINTIFLVFIGGITYTEIEGIRYLNRKYKKIYDESNEENKIRKQFIIITTNILNTKKLYASLGKNFGSIYTMKKYNEDINQPTKKK